MMYLHWEINSHTMALLDKVQDSVREELLRKSLEVVVLCRKMMRGLRSTEIVNQGEEKLFMTELDRALEGLMLG
jgi:hypothetical protein